MTCIPTFRADDKLVVNMTRRCSLMWQLDGGGGFETFPINSGILPAACRPAIEVLQLHTQHGGLDFIEPEISAKNLVMIFGLESVVPQQLKPPEQSVAAGCHHPPSPIPPRFLEGKKLKQPSSPMEPALCPFSVAPSPAPRLRSR